jgi:hypothetical protein
MQQLLGALLHELARRPDVAPVAASSGLWALARLQPAALPPGPLAALQAAAGRMVGSMGGQELANAAWALGRLRREGHRQGGARQGQGQGPAVAGHQPPGRLQHERRRGVGVRRCRATRF